jgi:hypothetical protein
MNIKISTSSHYKSLFVLPQIWITWQDGFEISLCWLVWCLDFNFKK